MTDGGLEPVQDEDLWIRVNGDPAAYVACLRQQGRIGPPQSFRPVMRPKQPVALPTSLSVMP